MKKYYEIYLTEDNVEEKRWSNFFIRIGRLNGIFRKFRIIVKFENQVIRYFLETNKEIPSILSEHSEFMLKEHQVLNFKLNKFKRISILTKKEKNLIDIFDKIEVKKKEKIDCVIVNFRMINFHNYMFKTFVISANKENMSKVKIRRFLFCYPHIFLSIDFSKHTRFLYVQNKGKYLNLEKTMHLFDNTSKDSVLEVDTFPYLQQNSFLNLNSYDFDKHSLVVGGSGTGKSKMICSIISKILHNPNYNMNYKVVIIDPHSSMENDIGGLENTTILNFKNENNSLNLFSNSNNDVMASSELMLTLFKNLIGDNYNSKLERVLRHSITVLLYNKCLSFQNLRKFILKTEVRNALLKTRVVPINVKEFFLQEFNELKTKSYQEAISPIISFIDEVQNLPAFRSSSDKLKNLEEVIKDNSLTIFSLNIESLGERCTKTIVSLLMSQMLELIQNYTFNEHIIFVIDEVAIIENPIIKRFLSEARKYNLSLILAQQYFNQITEELQKAIFANVSNYYAFRVSREDAILLSGSLAMEIAIHNSHFTRVKMLTELANRECIVKVSSNDRILPAFKGRTLDLKSIPAKQTSIVVNDELIDKTKNKKISKFNIDAKISLTDLMKSQSTGRKKLES